MNKLRVILIMATALIVSWPVQSFAQDDRIFGRKGTPTRGTIVRMTPNEIVMDAQGSQRTFQVSEILKVSYAEDSAELRTARDRVIQGQLEDALELLGQIDPGQIRRDVVKQDVEYYRGFCQAKLALSGGGDKAAAGRALYAFVQKYPGSYHFYEANEVIGDIFLALGKYSNAAESYRTLSAAPWPDYKMRSAVLEARALRLQNEFEAALAKYGQVLSAALDDPEAQRQKLFANIGKAVCLAETGKADEGAKLLEGIIAKNDPQDTELFGRAYNALGTCHRKADRPKDALLAYLHTDILFYADADVHAEALYHLIPLWDEVRKSERALRARNLLRSRYAGSIWAARLND